MQCQVALLAGPQTVYFLLNLLTRFDVLHISFMSLKAGFVTMQNERANTSKMTLNKKVPIFAL